MTAQEDPKDGHSDPNHRAEDVPPRGLPGWVLKKDSRLGPYVIVSALGAGGMGEVYRARDARLGRDVAIKILSQSVSNTADFARFEREARAIASINHPQILAIHDVGSQDGIHYLVSELVDGSTLREILKNGKLSARRAVDYAKQIAQGLAGAHAKGFLHRDLKPENILVRKDGMVKILDFGLAKQMAKSGTGEESTAETVPGVVMGTVSYMAPEQVRGEELDARADIFAFGAVLFEMLTGRRAFSGRTWVETANAVLHKELPELSDEEEKGIPATLRQIAYRCLEKNRENRFESAKDLWFTLDSLSLNTARLESYEITAIRKWPRSAPLAWAGAVALGLVIGVLGFFWGSRNKVSQPSYDRVTFRKGPISAARFTPDERGIIYGAAWENSAHKIYKANLDGSETRALDLSARGLLSVSRSGELAVRTDGNLAQVSMTGGTPRELLENVLDADWSRDGTQLAVAVFENGKWQIQYPIGHKLYETSGMIWHMRLSPQGDRIAFMDYPIWGDDRGTVAIIDTKGNKRTLTPEWNGEQGLAWSPDGKEVWFTATTTKDWDRPLYAVDMAGKLRMVLRIPGAIYLEDIASDGRVLLRLTDRRYEICGVSNDYSPRLLSWTTVMTSDAISRDGKYAVVTDDSGTDYGLYMAPLDGSAPIHIGSGLPGSISGDNKWVASVPQTDTSKIQVIPTGPGPTRYLSAAGFKYDSTDWTIDGKDLVILASHGNHPARYWLQSLDGGMPMPIGPEARAGPFLRLNQKDYIAAKSPDEIVWLYPVHGGEPIRAEGIRQIDSIVGGSIDSDWIYVSRPSTGLSLKIEKVNVRDGHREFLRSLFPLDSAGILRPVKPIFSDNPKDYIFSQVRELSVLYVVSGLN